MGINQKYKTAIVTGVPGWLGSRLVDTLLKGLKDHPALQQPNKDLEIRCLSLPNTQLSSKFQKSVSNHKKVHIFYGDVTDKKSLLPLFESLKKPVVLFHIAGIIHPKKSKYFLKINFRGSQNILDFSVQHKVKRAVIMSSNSPIGTNPFIGHIFDEESPYNPYMGYGKSKMLMEQYALSLSKQIETVVVRSPWFYGPNQPERQKLFFQMIQEGKAPLVGSGENLRSMAYIDNICQGLLLSAITPKAKGSIYWISDEKPYAMNEIIETIENLIEKDFKQKCKHTRMQLPNLASFIAYWVDKVLQSLGLYNSKIHVLSEMNKNIACSIEKAKKELGYKPKYDLKKGMKKSLKEIY